MEKIKDKEIGIDWRPAFEGADLRHVERLEAEAASSFALMRKTRQALNVTQAELAAQLETTQAAVSKMEKRGAVDVNTLQALAALRNAKLSISMELPDGRHVKLLEEGTV